MLPASNTSIMRVLKWMRAQDLATGDSLLSIDGKSILVVSVSEIQDEFEVGSIEVAAIHNYFVSPSCILVHNEPITIGIGLAWAFGGGAIEFIGAQVTVLVAGLIGAKLFKGSDDKYDFKPEVDIDGWNDRGSGWEPDDDEEETPGSANIGLEDVLSGAKRAPNTKGKSKIYEKSGNFSDAQRDFNKLNPSNVKNIDKGKVGTLRDGKVVNVRSGSSDTRPTLEIRHGNRIIKIRYGTK